MKNNLILLARVLLKGGVNTGKKNRKGLPKWLLVGLIALAFTPMVGQVVFFSSAGYDLLSKVGIQGIILSLALALSAFVIFFFGIFYVLNTFYFTNDIESLLPLPIRPFEILGAKFIVVTAYEYLTELIVLLPVLIVYGIKDNAGPIYYLYAGLVFLILPVIPLVIASLIIMPIMRFTGIVKNKDRFKYAVSMIALFIGLGVNFGVQKFANRGMNAEEMVQSLTELNRSLDVTSKFFPSSKYAALGLVESAQMRGLTNILLFIVISAAAIILFLYLGELLYFKGVMGISEAYSKRKAISSDELDKKAVKNPVIKTYLLKELKLLFRTPVYFINCILMNFLWPLFLLIPFFSQSGSNSQMGKLTEYLDSGKYNGIMLAAGFGFVLFIVATSAVTSTSISREGQNLYISKYIPVRFMDQILAKILSGVVIGLIGMLMMIITGGALFKIQAPILMSMFITGLAAILFGCFSGMLLDLLNPKLNWDNEQKAVKQNLNLIFNMLVCVIFAVVNLVFVIILNLTLVQTLLGILVVYGLLDMLLYYILSTFGVKLYQKIEN